MSSTIALPERNRLVVAGVGAAVASQVVLLALVGLRNRHLLNPDATGYILTAEHYMKGEFRLAVTGYWGPMISWLMAPILPLTGNPLDAARIIMGLSSLVFLVGCVTVLRNLQIDWGAMVLGSWLAAIASVSWSVENITPDLLMSGLLFLAISRLISPRWLQSRRTQSSAGMLFGAAYLTKSVALPAGTAMIIAIALLWILTEPTKIRMILRSMSVTLVALLLVAGPWIVILSAKYRTVVISTSARAAHSIVGPPDIDRADRGDNTFMIPESGRISHSEDPTSLPDKYWSPFESREYFKYQLSLIFHNASTITDFIAGFDRLHVGLLAVLFGLLVHRPWRENIEKERWRWSGVFIACVCAPYLVVYAGDERYYYAAYPFLVAASLGMVVWMTRTTRQGPNIPRLLGRGLIVLSFLIGPSLLLVQAVHGLDDSIPAFSIDLAKKLRTVGVDGPLAAVGDCTGRIGLYSYYTAFFLHQPYHNCEKNPSLARVKASGAKLILVHRALPLIADLDRDSAFESLDSTLFESREETAGSPLKVYRVRTN